MKWFNNISIRNKLLVGFGLVLICLAIIAGTAYTSVRSISEAQAILFHQEFPHSLSLVKFRNALSQDRVMTSRIMRSQGQTEKKEAFEDLVKGGQELSESFEVVKKLSTQIPGLGNNVQHLSAVLNDYMRTRDEQTIPLLKEGKNLEAQEITAIQYGRFEKMMEIAFNLSSISEGQDRDLVKKSEAIAIQSNYIVSFVGILAIIISIAVILSVLSSVATPLKELSVLTERVAYGDLTVNIHFEKRKDEVGTLQFMFGMMVSSLRQITIEIRSVVEALTCQVDLEGEAGDKDPASPELSALGQKLKKLIEEYKV